MTFKYIEIRDSATCIDVMTFRFDLPDSAYFPLRRALWKHGYGRDPEDWARYTYVLRLDTGECHFEPEHWNPKMGRTMQKAHEVIHREFNALNFGDVVDVQFELGETTTKKTAEWKEA